MLEYKNTEKFFEWLGEVLKEEKAEFLQYKNVRESWLEDVWTQHCCSGSSNFEVPSYMTESHNPECYYFDVCGKEDNDGNWDTVITF